MAFQLKPLPFSPSSLAPYMSAETLHFHHDKHHRAYVDKLNELVAGSDHAGQNLEDIILNTSGALFNNAAQTWNHDFFWQSLAPDSNHPHGELKNAIVRDFGSLAKFQEIFNKACVEHFGSGWGWLVKNSDGRLQVYSTHDANNPLRDEKSPLLCCDIWEHAYYIDYRNERARFVQAFWNVVNWEAVAERFQHSVIPSRSRPIPETVRQQRM